MNKNFNVSLVAPSGYPLEASTVHRGLERLCAYGCALEHTAAAQRRFQRFAGTDEERAADLNRLIDPAQERPDIVLAVRGGYGATRILPKLDYAGLRRRFAGTSTAFVGHSDFTAIQMALLARSGLITFGGPTLCSHFGAETMPEFTLHHFWQALESAQIQLTSNVCQAQSVNVSGTLWGGNLAVLVSLIGTPYLPQIEGGILFIEDINEHPFRLERMVYQLHFAGVLARQQALVLGDFSGIRLAPHDNGYDFMAMVEQIRTVIGIPVVTGLPFGHCADLVTLPVGASAQLVAHAQGFRLTVSDYPHL
ncbi:muramoyltetrapeptide carboxypeptidase [Mycoavidus sp. B2-EB]|uniref:muramoyltetrapeptide carboxypeptidase n=1 Tax=Mycoavidus sp. B2-EB TaxID=2651972 RepID=UPI0016243110|nr:muramoyltetrapeptide carboxypeptidase [Mycoavidus sp. B2-EB]BBO59942.1 L,D-carboxypeptidase A [Mycoavidus sp. B2-EB]